MRTFRPGFIFTCLLLFASGLIAQQGMIAPVGGWTGYVSHKSTVAITKRHPYVYAATQGGVFSWHVGNGEIQQFSTIDGLSRIDPTTLHTDTLTGNIYIGFNDGMINVLDSSNRITYISDIARTDLFTTKRINRMEVYDRLLYIATEFGIVVYDIDEEETRYSVTKISDIAMGTPVRDLTISRGRLWAAMGSHGIWSVDLSSPNITAPGEWVLESGSNRLPAASFSYICSTGDIVYTLLRDTIFKHPPGEDWLHAPFPKRPWTFLDAMYDRVVAVQKRFTGILHPDSTYEEVDNNGNLTCAFSDGDALYLGDGTVGLQQYWSGFLRTISPEGPKNNFVQDLVAGNGELYIAPRGKKGSSGRHYDKSGIPYFALHNNRWFVSDWRNGELQTDDVYQDFARAVYNDRTGKCYVGSWGEGIVELEGGKPVRTYTPANSGMTQDALGDAKVSGLAFDEFDNLWITFINANIPINVLTPEGEWYAIDPPLNMSPIGIAMDDYNNKWIIDQGNGLVVFNENYTLDDPTDDFLTTITTTFGAGGLPNNSVFTVVQDKDEQVWIGTSEGATILYDPSVIWTPNFQDAACPIIDGFCLLRDQQVNDIVVDGANRKWLATENGVYQVNVDGTELLHHFTAENSPLFDNDIKALAIDASTGEVFFGTNKGVISYMGDAIEGREDAEELYVYPNPVFDDYQGVIMIKGMRENSRIKIATAAGRVVRELDSFGGEVPWDGLDAFGNRVAPGIYLIMVADANGEGAGITKMAIIERQQ